MIKVTGGKRYNTETSTLIAEYWNGCSDNDFHYVREELYRTAKGNYFIVGEGGALSKYGSPVGNNSMTGSVQVIPVSKREALRFTETSDTEFSDAVKAAPEFLEMIEDA